MNIQIISDPLEQPIHQINHEILKNKTKYGNITFNELKQVYDQEANARMDWWLPMYIGFDETRPINFFDEGVFEQYIYDSIWKSNESPTILSDRLRFLARDRAYKQISESIGTNWKDKTIIDFGAGKCIHSWLLADLFKQVVSVDILSVDLFIGLTIHQRLGYRNNVNFYLGDITTCYDEIIEKYQPDFLLFQLGGGFYHLAHDAATAPTLGKILAQSISDKYKIPFYYT